MNKKIMTGYWVMMFFCFSVDASSLIKQPYINLELPSLNDYQRASLSDYEGQVIYLDFWASWCKPCRHSFPVMNQWHKKYAPAGLKIIAVNLDQVRDNADTFLQQMTPEFLVLWDPEQYSAKRYQIPGMPSSVLIDRQGNIRLVHRGFSEQDRPNLEKAIEVLLNE